MRRRPAPQSREDSQIGCSAPPQVWDLVEARALARLPAARGAVTSVACDPRRLEVLTGSHDGTVKLWAPTR